MRLRLLRTLTGLCQRDLLHLGTLLYGAIDHCTCHRHVLHADTYRLADHDVARGLHLFNRPFSHYHLRAYLGLIVEQLPRFLLWRVRISREAYVVGEITH